MSEIKSFNVGGCDNTAEELWWHCQCKKHNVTQTPNPPSLSTLNELLVTHPSIPISFNFP